MIYKIIYILYQLRNKEWLNEEILRVFACGKGIVITKAIPFKDKKIYI